MRSVRKLIINAAITGCVLSKNDNPYLPVSQSEVADCARRVQDAGAAIVHVHARNADQTPCFESSVYRDWIGAIRDACGDLILCVSLSGRHVQDIEKRAAALASRPDMASLTVGSMNFATQPSVNAPDAIGDLTGRIYAAGAIPELEIFEAGFIHFTNHLIKREVLRPPYYYNIILGSLGAAPLDLLGLGHMTTMLPAGATWSVGGLGEYQLDANVMAMAAGGHVRVGLEDNIYYDRAKTELADNVRLIQRLVRIAREMGREPASPAEARRMIGMPASV